MIGGYFFLALSIILVNGVFGVETGEIKTVSVGDSVNLDPGFNVQPNETVQWYFNGNLIAQISGNANTTSLNDGDDGMFKGRMKVDYQTRNLTIENLTREHTGHYEAYLNGPIVEGNSIISQSSNVIYVNVNAQGLSSGAISGMCFGVLVLVGLPAGGVVYKYSTD